MNQRAARHGDHPRVCGEHTMASSGVRACSGSSPRMRGTLVQSVDAERGDGIIPAYAGNTGTMFIVESAKGDHPRVCGEHLDLHIQAVESAGSSPRMRGTRERHDRRFSRRGIIPAYAGNTYTWRRRCLRGRDHPRVCGEHVRFDFAPAADWGSSPRMRGTPYTVGALGWATGIIPAYAGNTGGVAFSPCFG